MKIKGVLFSIAAYKSGIKTFMQLQPKNNPRVRGLTFMKTSYCHNTVSS